MKVREFLPCRPHSQGNPLGVIFRHGTEFFRGYGVDVIEENENEHAREAAKAV